MKENKTCQIHIRVTPKEKKDLIKTAAKAGITITELISARLQDMPIKDYQKEIKFSQVLNELTQQLGYIGNNINQAIIAIHTANSSNKEYSADVKEFNGLTRQYLEKRYELSENLKKIFFT